MRACVCVCVDTHSSKKTRPDWSIFSQAAAKPPIAMEPRMRTANSPASIIPTWKQSVHSTALMPPWTAVTCHNITSPVSTPGTGQQSQYTSPVSIGQQHRLSAPLGSSHNIASPVSTPGQQSQYCIACQHPWVAVTILHRLSAPLGSSHNIASPVSTPGQHPWTAVTISHRLSAPLGSSHNITSPVSTPGSSHNIASPVSTPG